MNDFGGVWRKSSGFGGSQVSVIRIGSSSLPIVFVNGVATASINGTDVTSGSINSTGANFLIVAVADFGSGATGTVTDSKSNLGWTPLTAYNTAGDARIHLYYCVPTSVGSGHTVSYTGTLPAIAFAAFSNVNAIPFDSEVGATGSTSNPVGGSITPSAAGALVISATANLGNNTGSVDSGFAIVGSYLGVSGNNYSLGMAYLIQTIAATVNPTWTVSVTNPWSATNAGFKN